MQGLVFLLPDWRVPSVQGGLPRQSWFDAPVLVLPSPFQEVKSSGAPTRQAQACVRFLRQTEASSVSLAVTFIDRVSSSLLRCCKSPQIYTNT